MKKVLAMLLAVLLLVTVLALPALAAEGNISPSRPTPGPEEDINDPDIPLGPPPDIDIDDPDIPLGPGPEEPDTTPTPEPSQPDTPDEEIPDEPVPLVSSPQTGDIG